MLLVLLDLLIAAWQVERDLRHVVHARVADVVDRDPAVGVALLDLHEAFGRTQFRCRGDADVLGTQLLEEQQLFVRRGRGRLDAEFDRRTSLLRSRLRAPARKRRRAECAEGHAAEIATVDTGLSRWI